MGEGSHDQEDEDQKDDARKSDIGGSKTRKRNATRLAFSSSAHDVDAPNLDEAIDKYVGIRKQTGNGAVPPDNCTSAHRGFVET